MNQLLDRYLSKSVCKKCKASQSSNRKTCMFGCGPRLRPRRFKK